jgi:hypothetical protein
MLVVHFLWAPRGLGGHVYFNLTKGKAVMIFVQNRIS